MYKLESFENHKFITIPILEEYGLKNLMTTNSLDMRLNNIDDISKYKYIINYLNINPVEVFQNNQNHTDNITIINKKDMGDENIFGRVIDNNDSLITNIKNYTLVSFSADCTPIIIFDKVNKVAANVHSGWKGTLKQIGPKTLIKMINQFNTDPKDVIVVLNPSISYEDFEVRNDVFKLFKGEFSNIDDYYQSKDKDKYNINLDKINIDNFIKLGVDKDNIINVDLSTYSNDMFHSYRRDGKNYKLMATFISLI